VNPDEESLQRLKALRGEGPADQQAPKAKPAFRTAQVYHPLWCHIWPDAAKSFIPIGRSASPAEKMTGITMLPGAMNNCLSVRRRPWTASC